MKNEKPIGRANLFKMGGVKEYQKVDNKFDKEYIGLKRTLLLRRFEQLPPKKNEKKNAKQ